jgi:hypothetical protein
VANEAARLMVVVVFPTPPFWLAKAIIFPIKTDFIGCEITNISPNSLQNLAEIAQTVDNSPFWLITSPASVAGASCNAYGYKDTVFSRNIGFLPLFITLFWLFLHLFL